MLPRSFTARARKGELRMRKFLLLFAGALTLLLSGCSTSEIGERAIIQAAAVDYDGEVRFRRRSTISRLLTARRYS